MRHDPMGHAALCILFSCCSVAIFQLQVDPPAYAQECEHDTHQVGNDQVEHENNNADDDITGENCPQGGNTEPVLDYIPAPDKKHHNGNQAKSFRSEERCNDSNHHGHNGDDGANL